MSANSAGLRGKEFGKEKFRILTIGTSIFDQDGTDDSRTWQSVLEAELRKENFDVRVFDASSNGTPTSSRVLRVHDSLKSRNYDLILINVPVFGNIRLDDRDIFRNISLPDWKNQNFSLFDNAAVNRFSNWWKYSIVRILGLDFDYQDFLTGKEKYLRLQEECSRNNLNIDLDSIKGLKANYEAALMDFEKSAYIKPSNTILVPHIHSSLYLSESEMHGLGCMNVRMPDNSEKGLGYRQTKDLIAWENNTFRLLAKKHSFTTIPYESFSPMENSDFWDQHHLTPMGSRKMAARLLGPVQEYLKKLNKAP